MLTLRAGWAVPKCVVDIVMMAGPLIEVVTLIHDRRRGDRSGGCGSGGGCGGRLLDDCVAVGGALIVVVTEVDRDGHGRLRRRG